MVEGSEEAHGRTELSVAGNGERRRKTCQRNETSKSNARGEDATVLLEAYGPTARQSCLPRNVKEGAASRDAPPSGGAVSEAGAVGRERLRGVSAS